MYLNLKRALRGAWRPHEAAAVSGSKDLRHGPCHEPSVTSCAWRSTSAQEKREAAPRHWGRRGPTGAMPEARVVLRAQLRRHRRALASLGAGRACCAGSEH
jgi:hypothetical protein